MRRVSIRRIIGLVVALALTIAAAYHGIEWRSYFVRLEDARTRDITRFDIDLSQPGSTEADYRKTFGMSHGVIACMHADTPDPTWPGLEGRVEVIDTDGAIVQTWPLPPRR